LFDQSESFSGDKTPYGKPVMKQQTLELEALTAKIARKRRDTNEYQLGAQYDQRVRVSMDINGRLWDFFGP